MRRLDDSKAYLDEIRFHFELELATIHLSRWLYRAATASNSARLFYLSVNQSLLTEIKEYGKSANLSRMPYALEVGQARPFQRVMDQDEVSAFAVDAEVDS